MKTLIAIAVLLLLVVGCSAPQEEQEKTAPTEEEVYTFTTEHFGHWYSFEPADTLGNTYNEYFICDTLILTYDNQVGLVRTPYKGVNDTVLTATKSNKQSRVIYSSTDTLWFGLNGNDTLKLYRAYKAGYMLNDYYNDHVPDEENLIILNRLVRNYWQRLIQTHYNWGEISLQELETGIQGLSTECDTINFDQ